MTTLIRMAVLTGVLVFSGCTSAPSNLFLRSQMNNDFRASRTEDRLIISLRDKPTPAEETAIARVREVFTEAGFQVVTDVTKADRIIYFGFAKEQVIEEGLAQFNRVDTVGGKPNIGNYRGLELYMLDTEAILNNTEPMVWRALVLTTEENFQTHSDVVLKQVTELYGKEIKAERTLKAD